MSSGHDDARRFWGRVGAKSLRGFQAMCEQAAVCRNCVLRLLNEPMSDDDSCQTCKGQAWKCEQPLVTPVFSG